MLTHDHIVEVKRRDELSELVENRGVVLCLKADQNLYVVLVLLFERAKALNVISRRLGPHAEGAVVVIRKKLRTVIGKA